MIRQEPTHFVARSRPRFPRVRRRTSISASCVVGRTLAFRMRAQFSLACPVTSTRSRSATSTSVSNTAVLVMPTGEWPWRLVTKVNECFTITSTGYLRYRIKMQIWQKMGQRRKERIRDYVTRIQPHMLPFLTCRLHGRCALPTDRPTPQTKTNHGAKGLYPPDM